MSLTKIRKSNIESNVQLPHANAAFDTANSSGVYANAAFAAANNASAGSIDSYARDTANSASSYANGAFAAANNAVDTWVRDAANSASSYANSGFGLANTANTLAQAAYDAANNATDSWVRDAANSASSYANSGYAQANTANTLAQSAFDAANNAVDTWVRDAANSASSYANSGFSLSNTTNTLAQAAYDAANTPSHVANSASIYANAAFDYANTLVTGGSFALSVVHDTFTADGTSNTFTLSSAPVNENYTLITLDGVVQHKSAYNIVSSNVVFSGNPDANTLIDVMIFSSANASYQEAYDHANAAFDTANNATDSWVRDASNSASSYANSAYSEANNKLNLSGGTLTGNLVVGGNVMPTTDNTYFLGSETVRWHSLYVGDGSIYIGDIVLSNDANKLAITDSIGNKVTISSNNIVLGDFVLSSTGAITGDVVITGNLNVKGTTAKLEVSGLIVDDNIIDINEATLGAPTLNAGVRVKRGDENPVLLRWNETNDRWEFTNDGSAYSNIASAAAETYANAAYTLANTKLSSSGGIVDGNLTVTGNLTISGNTTTVDVETLRVSDPIILLANNNTTDLVDIGFTAHYGETEKHTGLIRHAATQEYYLFDNYDGHILHQNNTVSISNADFRIVTLHANLKSNSVVVRGHDVLSHTNLSFDVANAASSYANSAFLRANTPSDVANSAGVYANASFEQANTATTNASQADQRAVTSGSYANSAFAAANNATDSWVRDASNSASSYANSSYIHANAAFEAANSGGAGTDSYARDTANSAGVYANAAFAVANTGGASSNSFYVNIVHDSFVATGSQDTFTLSAEPIDENYTLVTINGIVQHKSAYSVSSTDLILSESPAANSEIDVVTYTRIGAGSFNLSIVLNTFSGDGTTNTFSLSTSPVNENYTSVVIDGVAQLKTSYNVSGSDLIFAESPDSGANIDVTIYTSIATEENLKIDLAYEHANAAYEQANTGGGGASAARAMTMAILFG